MAGSGIEELERAASSPAARTPEVSEWSVGRHVHHCCLSMIGICDALAASQPPAPRARFQAARSYILLTGRIPRGSARAPKVVVPPPEVDPDELARLLARAGRRLTSASALDPGHWFEHPFLGVFSRRSALSFLRIHNRHHLRIIKEILGRE